MDSVAAPLGHCAPKGSVLRVLARPLRVWRLRRVPSTQGGRAIPPAQHPKMPYSRRSSRRAGASVQLPKERVRARCVVRLAVFRGFQSRTSHRSRGSKLWTRASSTQCAPLVRRPEGPPKEVFSDPTGVERGQPQAVSHSESCRTPLMVFSKIAPPSTSTLCVHSQRTAVPDQTRCSPG